MVLGSKGSRYASNACVGIRFQKQKVSWNQTNIACYFCCCCLPSASPSRIQHPPIHLCGPDPTDISKIRDRRRFPFALRCRCRRPYKRFDEAIITKKTPQWQCEFWTFGRLALIGSIPHDLQVHTSLVVQDFFHPQYCTRICIHVQCTYRLFSFASTHREFVEGYSSCLTKNHRLKNNGNQTPPQKKTWINNPQGFRTENGVGSPIRLTTWDVEYQSMVE